jgi:YidC/Oxa1 family membrane protein insertase
VTALALGGGITNSLSFLNPLYSAVSQYLVIIHSGLAHIFGADSGAAWGLSVVLLTISLRILIFPLFVKQIKSQRAMQVLQPKMKELQKKYKGDRERLNQEMMALYKEHGANPLSGCLPLLPQIPIFIALFHSLDAIKPKLVHGVLQFPNHVPGFSHAHIVSAAKAQIFGAPLSASFTTGSDVLHKLGASGVAPKIVIVILIIVMGSTTFLTQRQLMARNKASGQVMGTQQKVLLYVLPVVFAAWGFNFPIGVLLYWVTSNAWSFGQQFFVIRRMPAASGGGGMTKGGGAIGGKGSPSPAPAPGFTPTAPAPGARPAPGVRPNPTANGGPRNGSRSGAGGGGPGRKKRKKKGKSRR